MAGAAGVSAEAGGEEANETASGIYTGLVRNVLRERVAASLPLLPSQG